MYISTSRKALVHVVPVERTVNKQKNHARIGQGSGLGVQTWSSAWTQSCGFLSSEVYKSVAGFKEVHLFTVMFGTSRKMEVHLSHLAAER